MARTDSKKTLGKRCDVTGQVIVDKPQLLSHVMWSSVKSQGQFAMINCSEMQASLHASVTDFC